MPDLPFAPSLIILIFAVALALALLTFVWMLLRRIGRLLLRAQGRQSQRAGITQNVLRFLLVILWATASAAVLFMAAFVQSFASFTKKELVAEVRCEEIEDVADSMLLQLTPVHGGERLKTNAYVLHGDQWTVEGNILKWDDWLNFAGLHTMFKLTRVRGRFETVQKEMSREATVFSLVQQEELPEWRWLFKYGHRLRFVESVYGNTVFTYPAKDASYEIYVTTSGFMVKVRPEASPEGPVTLDND